ncbi:amphoterin-induced protein 3 [Oncorhynchus clarkii lewisi]|uniref:amphoterin-induced protein 3 n=1 Tax=Oncorhynchus clarkii lewisi TaxID=490388 RepID=UPI0039B8EDAD
MLRSQAVTTPLVLNSLLLVLLLQQAGVRAETGVAAEPGVGASESGVGASRCPKGCLCCSDILSCVDKGLKALPSELPVYTTTLDLNHNRLKELKKGSFAALPRLESLRLAHNSLKCLEPGTFWNSSALRQLDLSSNQLEKVEVHYFLELTGLEELLLFNNRIVRVESKALEALGNLRKVYISHNRLTDFPFSIQEDSHPFLATMDLSSNSMSKLPLVDIETLPAALQSGLFLHNNTLICECEMYNMFRRWEQKGFPSVSDFREEHTCLVYGEHKASVKFFHHRRFFEVNLKCSTAVAGALWEPEGSLLVYEGDAVVLDCHTMLKGQHLTYLWVSPHHGAGAPPENNGTLRMHANGSLEIVSAQVEDSGVYWCKVFDGTKRNESWEVNVTVLMRQDETEPFNTGFTTLIGCVTTLVLVLMYLYLTPCHCWCHKQPPLPGTPSPANDQCSAQSSILTPTPPATTEGPGRKVSNNKHVVFLEPIKEVQNGRLRAATGALSPVSVSGHSITSVFSDSPIVP